MGGKEADLATENARLREALGEMEERILASPALIDGALFLRSEEHLWKIGS